MMERKDLLKALQDKNYSLASIESLTGGLFASTFTSIPGASKVFKGALVTYTDEVKETFGVEEETIKAHGAISPETAKEMVLAAYKYFKADVIISFTGNAGPDASEDKPVGLVYCGLKVADHLYVYQLELSGDRDEIRKKVVDFGFKTILEKLNPIREEKQPEIEPVSEQD